MKRDKGARTRIRVSKNLAKKVKLWIDYLNFLKCMKVAIILWRMQYSRSTLLTHLGISYVVSIYTCLLYEKWGDCLLYEKWGDFLRWGDMNLEKDQIQTIWKFYYRYMSVGMKEKSKNLFLLFVIERKQKNNEKSEKSAKMKKKTISIWDVISFRIGLRLDIIGDNA